MFEREYAICKMEPEEESSCWSFDVRYRWKINEELQSANFLLLFFGYLCLKIVNGWIHKMYFSCSISKIYFSVLFFLPLIVSFSLFSNIFLSFTKVYLNIGFGEIILWDHSKRTCDLVSTLIEITSYYFHLMKQ